MMNDTTLPSVSAAADILEKAKRRAVEAELIFDHAVTALEDGLAAEVDDSTLAQLHDASIIAKRALSDAQGAVRGCERRLNAVQDAEVDRRKAAAWQAVKVHVQKRVKIAEKIVKHAEQLAAAQREMHDTSEVIRALLPDQSVCLAGSLLGSRYLAGAISEAMTRAGCGQRTDSTLHWELAQRPTLPEKIKAANDYMMRGAE